MILCALALLAFQTGAMAQSAGSPAVSPPPPGAANPRDGSDEGAIVVTAREPGSLKRYVRSVTYAPRDQQLSRWQQPLCLGFRGPGQDTIDYLTTHLQRLAASLDVKSRSRGCHANVVIIFASDANDLAARLLKIDPSLVGHGRASADAFLRSRAIRWMSAAETVGADGIPIPTDSRGTGFQQVWSSSLIKQSTRRDLTAVLIIIDPSLITHLNYGQLADYLGMVIFAHPDLGSTYVGDTVLGIFPANGGPPPSKGGLTISDRSLLRALYSVPANMTANSQIGLIEDVVAHTSAETALKVRSALDDQDGQ